MKCNKTYSLNVEVVKAFEEEVEDQTRSRLIEALMIEFLVKYSRERPQESHGNVDSDLSQKEII
uniref:ORF68 n=1 Tax=Nitrosopumilaceae spindle-shaped virus TaxID=3065433 RepID=A0AAT9JHW6_9VIRU